MAAINNPEALAVGLYDIGCVRFGEMTLTSGLTSPVYFDLGKVGSIDGRSSLSRDQQLGIRDTIVGAYAEQLAQFEGYDHIIGIPLDGHTIAGLLTYPLKQSILGLRPFEKTHGVSNWVEGSWHEGETIIIIDDLVSTAKSLNGAREKIESVGLKVGGAAVLLDRDQGGRENLANQGVRLETAIGVASFIQILSDEKRITDAQAELMRGYFLGA